MTVTCSDSESFLTVFRQRQRTVDACTTCLTKGYSSRSLGPQMFIHCMLRCHPGGPVEKFCNRQTEIFISYELSGTRMAAMSGPPDGSLLFLLLKQLLLSFLDVTVSGGYGLLFFFLFLCGLGAT